MNFSVSGRMMSHLGEALISDEAIALGELIKNAYDADANFVSIEINSSVVNDYQESIGQIIIYDDGQGMTISDIKDGFLRLGTDNKIRNKISKKFKRISQGNKGIGRLSLHRLSEQVKIITKSAETGICYSLLIDWSLFEMSDNLTTVSIPVNIASKSEEAIFDSKFLETGTVLILTGLKNSAMWDEPNTIKRIEQEFISLINPYNRGVDNFNIEFDINGEFLSSDKYQLDSLRIASDVHTTLEFFGEDSSKPNTVKITTKRSDNYLKWRLTKLINKMYDFGFILDNYTEKNKIDYDILINKIKEKSIRNVMFTEDEFRIDLSRNYISLSKDFILHADSSVGSFSGEIFAYNSLKLRLTEEQQKIVRNALGVQLFRNGFKVAPYGKDFDWFNFTKYSQTSVNNSYKMHTTAGYINIDGEYNSETLKEMSNREGLIQDNYGENFLNIIKYIISRYMVEKDVEFRENLDIPIQELREVKKGEMINFMQCDIVFIKMSESIERQIETIETVKNSVKNDSPNAFETVKSLEKVEEILRDNIAENKLNNKSIKEKEKKLEKYTYYLGTMLISEALSHEIQRQTRKIIEYAKRTKDVNSVDSHAMEKIAMLQLNIINCSNYISRHASILDKHSYAMKRKFEEIDVKEFLITNYKNSPLFETSEGLIDLNIIGSTFFVNAVAENLAVAIENLIINSTYWLVINKIKKPSITVALIDGNIIEIYDNGYGIHKNIEDSLFNEFETMKPDGEGRGIGLWIVKNLLQEISSSIRLLDKRNSKGNKYVFQIKFKE